MDGDRCFFGRSHILPAPLHSLHGVVVVLVGGAVVVVSCLVLPWRWGVSSVLGALYSAVVVLLVSLWVRAAESDGVASAHGLVDGGAQAPARGVGAQL